MRQQCQTAGAVDGPGHWSGWGLGVGGWGGGDHPVLVTLLTLLEPQLDERLGGSKNAPGTTAIG